MRNNYDPYLEYEAEKLARKIVNRYGDHDVAIDIKDKHMEVLGECFKYRLKLGDRTKVGDIEKLADDVRRSLKLSLLQVIKEDIAVYIIASKEAIERDNRLRRIMASPEYMEGVKRMRLVHPVGFDAAGIPYVDDLSTYPNLVIGGTTISGKTVGLKSLLLSLAIQYLSDELRLLICDRAGDLDIFDGIPQLAFPVVQDPESFLRVILKLKAEVDRRVPLKRSKELDKLPSIVFAVDEFTSFISDMLDKKKRDLAATTLLDILRRGRHVKVHSVLAVHDPVRRKMLIDLSDIPGKMAFRVTGLNNSRTLLGVGGAEKLKGVGEMIFNSPSSEGLKRLQGSFISDEELESVLDVIRRRYNKRESADNENYDFRISEADLSDLESDDGLFNPIRLKTTKQEVDNALFAEIMMWVLRQKEISCNALMKTFNIGWTRANGYLDKLNSLSIISNVFAKTPRIVLVNEQDDLLHNALDFLQNQGYSTTDITEAFNSKGAGTTQSDSKN